MTKTIQRKLFRQLFPATNRVFFCLGLLVHLCTLHFANTPAKEKNLVKTDSITITTSGITGKIFLQGGAYIWKSKKTSSLTSSYKKEQKKESLALSKKTRSTNQTETPKRQNDTIAKGDEKVLVPSRSSGVSFSEKAQTESLVLQDNSSNVLLTSVNTNFSFIYTFLTERKAGFELPIDPELAPFAHIFCVRPPPGLSKRV
ncbi:hypothetical protein [Chryseobacterium foetidum]|uniref:hypothetical protein n=1 Tax=Chryseobacterium foetidum TaxID=2951057 RepID=UPI0021C73570|nr:hypothetical protein [Chryseobacterium foetidum]